jgi:lysozyme
VLSVGLVTSYNRLLLVAVALVLAAAGLIVWYGWLPHYRPAIEANESYGIDVSHHQGDIDWARVADDDITFAYIKATEGGDFVDTQFADNWEQAGANGVDRGAYHFFTLCRPGLEQAENFLRVMPSDLKALPPAVDLELSGNCSQRPERAWVLEQLEAFLERVESVTGQDAVLYLLDDFEQTYRIRDAVEREHWERRILFRPTVKGWWMWQVHARAAVDGIDGPADLNVMRSD